MPLAVRMSIPDSRNPGLRGVSSFWPAPWCAGGLGGSRRGSSRVCRGTWAESWRRLHRLNHHRPWNELCFTSHCKPKKIVFVSLAPPALNLWTCRGLARRFRTFVEGMVSCEGCRAACTHIPRWWWSGGWSGCWSRSSASPAWSGSTRWSRISSWTDGQRWWLSPCNTCKRLILHYCCLGRDYILK